MRLLLIALLAFAGPAVAKDEWPNTGNDMLVSLWFTYHSDCVGKPNGEGMIWCEMAKEVIDTLRDRGVCKIESYGMGVSFSPCVAALRGPLT